MSKSNRLNKIGILRIQVKRLDQEIEACNGVQVQRLYAKRSELKKKVRSLCK